MLIAVSITEMVILYKYVKIIIKELDDTYQYYDNQLNATLQKVDRLVDQISETTKDSLSYYLTYTALALSVVNSIATITACKSICRVILHRISKASLATTTSQPTVTVQQHSSNI